MEYKVLLQYRRHALVETETHYIVACEYDETQQKGQQWGYGLYFPRWSECQTENVNALYNAIETFREKTEENYISRSRLENLAMQLKDGLIEDDKETAMEYFNNICEMTEEEKEWFGIDKDMEITVLDRRTSNLQREW